TVRLAVAAYWLNIALLGAGLALTSRHLPRAELIGPNSFDRLAVFRRRILIAQLGYAAAALLCLASTYASVAALATVELYFIVSPRIPILDRLLQQGNDHADGQ